jgi:hypothetical protein
MKKSLHRILEDAHDVVRTIEETLTSNDPYNNPDHNPEYSVSLQDCDFPDHIEDPLEVIYLAYGEEVLGRLQYVDDLELTLNHMESAICIVSNSPELQHGLEESDTEGAESPVGEEVQGQEGAVHP